MLAATGSGNLAYDGSGFDVYASFFDEIEPQLTPDVGELSFMAEWAGKLHGNMTRFAGLIHCITAFEQGSNPLLTPILSLLVERGYIRIEYAQTGNAGRPAETIFVNPETQNIVTKLTLLNNNGYSDDKVNLVTIPANVPLVKSAADFSEFLKLSDDELKDVPF